mmetsp:Transcript_14097/g.20567  ORF Transcript_14097/g.20567 Transcript_14097/m.20567 type:complete len:338 (+) Transcript_14097:102-1115(+)
MNAASTNNTKTKSPRISVINRIVALFAACVLIIYAVAGTLPSVLQSEMEVSESTLTKSMTPIEPTTTPAVCTLRSGPNDPIPVIMMSIGRSGSSSIWNVMGNLTGKVTHSDEYTGSATVYSNQFFSKIPPNDGGNWALGELCRYQNRFPRAGIVGFKWKPWTSIYKPSAISGLELFAKSEHPTIKVVRSRRNPLDIFISTLKHRTSHVSAHCAVDDKKCLEKHLLAGTGIHLPTEKLLKKLEEKIRQEDKVDDLLANMGVPHVRVTYENLFHGDDAEEWMRIFRFLGRGPGEGLTRDDVNNAMGHVDTSIQDHKIKLSNYEEVKNLLQGTKFEALLH